ncbi:hypothetical protein HISP_08321 [Haloarcula hispanica N601]|uniref:Uncharacterized protein n=2 Tax=Haloarcula hispanica TaxID=51589 RepID=W0GDR2_HALHI|nr:hypothetical protein HAH_1632 [Haloarcula hispanica ATCC 33960]AHF55862.1 hypothetical protein HISP_08321 [Haloarcula hispanica N601]
MARYGVGFVAQCETLSNHDAKATDRYMESGGCTRNTLLELTHFPDYRLSETTAQCLS